MAANKDEEMQPLILKGRHWYIHSTQGAPGELRESHLIHWHDEEYIASICQQHIYLFDGWSPQGSMPRFREKGTNKSQVSGTVLRHPNAVKGLCPTCRNYLEGMRIHGLLVPMKPKYMHPDTVREKEANK